MDHSLMLKAVAPHTDQKWILLYVKRRLGQALRELPSCVSKDAIKAMGREIGSWHIARRSDKSLGDLARMFNSTVRGWINYYGRFYKSMLCPLLRRINEHLVRWACRKYKRLHRREKRARELLAGVLKGVPLDLLENADFLDFIPPTLPGHRRSHILRPRMLSGWR